MSRTTNRSSTNVKKRYDSNANESGISVAAGIYLGVVIDPNDPSATTNNQGRIKVQINRLFGTVAASATSTPTPEQFLGAVWAIRMLPIGGLSPVDSTGGQNSYGLYSSPPSIGNTVIVAISADIPDGVILGVVPSAGQFKNGTGPVTGTSNTGKVGLTTELPSTKKADVNAAPPEHPQNYRLQLQGLEKDRIRGQNYASPARDPASKVSGISTPGGHAISMDDGSTTATGNKILRIRSGAGAQILMDDTNGFTYIVNRDGTSWIELNRNGDVDIYSKGGINVHTEGDYNIHVGGTFNLQASGINMLSDGSNGIAMSSPAGDINIFAGTNLNLQADANGNLRIAGNLRTTAGRIDMNGPNALAASQPLTKSVAGNKTVTNSIAGRVPEAEPWPGHLDISTLSGVAGGAGSYANSKSYYGGSPTSGNSDQVGNFTNHFPQSSNSAMLTWQAKTDRRVDPRIIKLTTEVATKFGRPLLITSGYRNPATNKAAGGANSSQHMLAKALDISGGGLTNANRLKLIELASHAGVIGIGVYDGGSLHFDIRNGARVGWGSNFSISGVPVYARTQIAKHMRNGFGGPQHIPGPDLTPASHIAPNKKSVAALNADPLWRAKLDAMKVKYPGLTDAKMYKMIQGESAFDTTSVNSIGAAGLFQFTPQTAGELGYTSTQVRDMSAADQLGVYDNYLSKWKYDGSQSLGIMQAAPAYAARPASAEIYSVGSSAWVKNPGWRGTDGRITVSSINAYYNNQGL